MASCRAAPKGVNRPGVPPTPIGELETASGRASPSTTHKRLSYVASAAECAIALQKVPACIVLTSMYDSVETLGVALKQFLRSHLELTGVFAGTFMKDKRGTADMRADLQSLCRAKTNKPRTDHLRLATMGPPDDTSD